MHFELQFDAKNFKIIIEKRNLDYKLKPISSNFQMDLNRSIRNFKNEI